MKDFVKIIYEKYKPEIDLISENSKREGWQADLGVATDMFIVWINSEEATRCPFIGNKLEEARNFVKEVIEKLS